MYNQAMSKIILLLLLIITLSSCKPQIDINKLTNKSQKSPAEIKNNDPSLADILKAEKLITLRNDSTLYLVDPQYPKPYPLYGFQASEKPTLANMDQFAISPSKTWIVWYTPSAGIVALNTTTLKTRIVQKPDDFLNTYPYFEFSKDDDKLHFIIDKGAAFMQIDLNTFSENKIAIPYPYGNVFKISPDQNKMLFTSGFAQANKPEFLITDKDGKLISQFSADINLTDRHLVFWSPNSLGIFLINHNLLQYYAIDDPNNPVAFFEFANEIKIDYAEILDTMIFLFTSDGYWHIIDFNTQKETARAPLEIASELGKPKFYPWGEKQFLIEETIADPPNQFKRLWLSDFKGVKKLVMEKYNETNIQNYPEKID